MNGSRENGHGAGFTSPFSLYPTRVMASTLDVPCADRFEWWRSEHRSVDISVSSRDDAQKFQCQKASIVGPDGVIAASSSYSANNARFGRDGQDMVLLSITMAGAATVMRGDELQRVTPEIGLVLLEGDRRTSTIVDCKGHDHAYLALPRSLVREALRTSEMKLGEVVRPLSGLPLVPFFTSQLRTLPSSIDGLAPNDAALLLSTMRDMALALLASQNELELSCHLHSRSDRALFESAERFVAFAFEDPDMTAGSIAGALNCSRTHLYAVYAKVGETIGNRLRQVRLDHAEKLLLTTRLSVAEIAFRVGYRDVSAFTRAFRARRQISPAAYRRQLKT
jgi:AraC family transcriptional regulator, positive regulator of tynA and feaB